MARRNFWGHKETKTMLTIMIDKNYMALTDYKIHDKNELYRKIKEDLGEYGFHFKNEEQIKTRWKNLKHQYAIAKKTNETCPFFEELDVLLNDDDMSYRFDNSFATDSVKSKLNIIYILRKNKFKTVNL